MGAVVSPSPSPPHSEPKPTWKPEARAWHSEVLGAAEEEGVEQAEQVEDVVKEEEVVRRRWRRLGYVLGV